MLSNGVIPQKAGPSFPGTASREPPSTPRPPSLHNRMAAWLTQGVQVLRFQGQLAGCKPVP